MAPARSFFPLLLLAAASLVSDRLAAQAFPISKQLEVAPPRTSPWPSATHHHWSPAVVELGPAGFAASWATYFTTTDPRDYDRLSDSVTGEWLSPEGRPGGLFLASTEVGDSGVGEPSLARIGADRFVAVMCQYRDLGADVWFRRFDAHGALDEESRVLGDVPDDRLDCGPSVASNAEGRFVIAWMRVFNQWTDRAVWRPMAQVFGADGEPVTPEVEVGPLSPGTNESRTAVGLDAAGNFTVLWQSFGAPSGAGVPPGTWGQRFDPAGNPLGERFRVGLGTPGIGGVAIAMAPSGGFVASWGERIAPGKTARLMRRFVRTGKPVGLQINLPGDVRQSWEPSLDRDRYGNVALFWVEGRKAALALFNKELIQQGPVAYEPPATLLTGLPNTSGDSVALTDDGRIFTVWLGPRARKARDSILGRIWQARKEADLCLFNRGAYSCDTANDGGGAEQRPWVLVQAGVANDPGARPAAGDFDNDGRDDLCVVQGDRVYCDVDHEGLTAEAASDPFVFGLADDDGAAIGDVNGDGQADVCVRRATVWHCDLQQGDGAAPDFTFTFLPGEGAMIGDVDGDGRDEACVADRGRFLCDTAHDGGLAETVLDLAPVLPRRFSGAPVLGDVDGDGKDDPCFQGSGRLLCGLFPRMPGPPPRAFELRIGFPGGAPVLADIDAF